MVVAGVPSKLEGESLEVQLNLIGSITAEGDVAETVNPGGGQ
mgnify:CR=1 FL=1